MTAYSLKKLLSNALGRHPWGYSLTAVINDKKAYAIDKLIDRLVRILRVINQNSEFDLAPKHLFAGKVIFEIGCGPLLGYGPLAGFFGGKKFKFSEPNLLETAPEIYRNHKIYFDNLYSELVRNFGCLISYERYRAFIESAGTINEDIVTADTILSNSVMEHIHGDSGRVLPQKLKIAKHFASVHVVDFGDHCSHPLLNPFDELYRNNRAIKDANLNKLRPSEMTKFINSEFGIDHKFLDYRYGPIPKNMHFSWKKYSQDELKVRTGIVYAFSPV